MQRYVIVAVVMLCALGGELVLNRWASDSTNGELTPVVFAADQAQPDSSTSASELSPDEGDLQNRDLRQRPFADDSPWNTPIAAAAKYGPALSAIYPAMNNGWINAAEHSVNVVFAREDDLPRTIRTSGGNRPGVYSVAMPDSAAGSAGKDSDQHLLVFAADGTTVHEFWKFPQSPIGNAEATTAQAYVRTDLRAAGWGVGWIRATGTSAAGGLVRAYDLQQGAIRHKLAIALPPSVLSKYWQPPADRKDGGLPQGEGEQTGTVNYGSVLAIPKNVDLAKLNLTPGGRLFARALQDYGAFVVDETGPNNAPPLYVEQPSGRHPLVLEAQRDIDKLIRLLVVVQSEDA